MESAKEKAIREAWINLIGETEFEALSVDENGLSKSSCLYIIPDSQYRDSVIQSTLLKGKMHYRPKSLQGIETNNGWTRIESEADLPTDEKAYYNAYPTIRTEATYYHATIIDMWEKSAITHYRKVESLPNPIY